MSLGTNFTRRRMMAAFNKELKYIWRVYNVESQLSGETTGSFSLTATRYKMASSSYTYVNGTFTLTNPTQTTASNLKVGDYLVNVTTSSNTTTSGTSLYEITAISGSSTRPTFSYKTYTSFSEVQGSNLLYEVGSDTMDYPTDGIWSGDGLWYVMVKGEYEVYVWNQYNTTSTQQYSLNYGTSTTLNWPTSGSSLSKITAYSSASVNSSTGAISVSGSTSITWATNGSSLAGKYFYSGSTLYYCNSTETGAIIHASPVTAKMSTVYSRGSSTGKTVESQNSSAYPNNGRYSTDGYWYVYSNSYMVEFDNR